MSETIDAPAPAPLLQTPDTAHLSEAMQEPMTSPPLRWLRDAMARKALAEHMSHYHFHERMAAATDGSLTAAYPMPIDVPTCLVKGEHIEAASRAMDGVPSLVLENGQMIMRGGRTRVTMPVVQQDLWTPTPLAGEWMPVPRGLIDLFTDLLPFVADGADNTSWLGCIAIADGYLWATDKKMAVRSIERINTGNINALVARSTVQFVIDRVAGLREWCVTPDAIGFRWENGAWMRSTLVQGQWQFAAVSRVMPDALRGQADHMVTNEWRESLARLISSASDAGKSTVTLRNASLTTSGGGLFIVTDVDNMLPEGMQEVNFSADCLQRMATVAQAWQPRLSPAPFVGQRVWGVMARHIGAGQS